MVPEGPKDVPPRPDLGETLDFVGLPADVKCHPSIFLSPALPLRLPTLAACQRCRPFSAASEEIHQGLDEYRALLSGNSDPAVLDGRLNVSPVFGDGGVRMKGERGQVLEEKERKS